MTPELHQTFKTCTDAPTLGSNVEWSMAAAFTSHGASAEAEDEEDEYSADEFELDGMM